MTHQRMTSQRMSPGHSTSRHHANPYTAEDLLNSRQQLRVSEHALREVHKDGLRGKDIIRAILTGKVVERYPQRRRVLISGRTSQDNVPLHVVCDYNDMEVLVAITAYVPNRLRWVNRRKRREGEG